MRRLLGAAVALMLLGAVMPTVRVQALHASEPTFTTQANVLWTSTAFNPNKNVSSVLAQITDPNNLYLVPDPANGYIITWGFQLSRDNGQTWEWGPVTQTEPPPGLLIVHHPRTSLMPNIFMEGSLIRVLPNQTRYRVAILTDTNATFGLIVEIN